MPRETLRTSLAKLHSQLSASTPALDTETRQLLRDVAEDIEAVLADSDPDAASLRGRIEQAAIRFEASHPQLAHTFTQIADALAKLGV
jgi:hypothetical protein